MILKAAIRGEESKTPQYLLPKTLNYDLHLQSFDYSTCNQLHNKFDAHVFKRMLQLQIFNNSKAKRPLVDNKLNSMANICSCQYMATLMLLFPKLCYTILANLQTFIHYLLQLLLFQFSMYSLKSCFKVYKLLIKVYEMLLTASIVKN